MTRPGFASCKWLQFALNAFAACALAGCPSDPYPCPDGAPSWCNVDGAASDAASDAVPADVPPGDYVPYIAGEFYRVYTPPGTRYLNDHTLVRGPRGWHLYGITHESQGDPHSERAFLHAVAPSLLGTWSASPAGDALVVDPAFTERVLWAPFVFESTGGTWTMYYETGWPDDPPLQELRRADSQDLDRWTRQVRPAAERPPGGRDPFVMRDEARNRWLLYSVGVTVGADGMPHGQILVTSSEDLATWTPARVVITDPVPNFAWGNLESPSVVPYGGAYYLFLTRTASDASDYVRTNVFRFRNLDEEVRWDPITDIRSHAAEIVQDGGRYFITSGGWPSYIGEQNRGLLIAPLVWARVE